MQAPDRRFNWRRGIIGMFIGLGVAVVASALGGSPWYWVAVPVGLGLGVTLRFEPNVLWGQK